MMFIIGTGSGSCRRQRLVERHGLLLRRGMGGGHGHAEDRVGAEPPLLSVPSSSIMRRSTPPDR
jgi:hypothetical protein